MKCQVWIGNMGKNVFVNILDISIFINHCEVDI